MEEVSILEKVSSKKVIPEGNIKEFNPVKIYTYWILGIGIMCSVPMMLIYIGMSFSGEGSSVGVVAFVSVFFGILFGTPLGFIHKLILERKNYKVNYNKTESRLNKNGKQNFLGISKKSETVLSFILFPIIFLFLIFIIFIYNNFKY